MSVAAPVRATGTLTSDATIPTAADTVTIGTQTYTFRAAVGTTANEVLLGANYTASFVNITSAINGSAGSGTTYGSNTVAHDLVVATNPTVTTVVLTAKVPGTIGNYIATTEAGTHTSFGAATLTGGTGSVHATINDCLLTSQCNSDVIKVLTQLKDS